MRVTAPSPSSALMYEVQGNSTRREMREEPAPSHYRECDEAHGRSSPRLTPSADLYCYATTDSKGRSVWWSCADSAGAWKRFQKCLPNCRAFASRNKWVGGEEEKKKINWGRYGLDGICSRPDLKRSAFFETTYFVIIALASGPLSFNLICLTLNSWNRFSLPWTPSSWLAECSWMLPKKRHLIPLIILPYVINWLPMVHCLNLSHGSNQSSAN